MKVSRFCGAGPMKTTHFTAFARFFAPKLMQNEDTRARTRVSARCFTLLSIFLSRVITGPGQGPGTVIILERNIESNVKNLAETRVLARASSFYIGFGAKKRAN